MVPHSWKNECLEMHGLAENIINLRSDYMLEIPSSGEILQDVHIQRVLFHGDSLSPLLFVFCMITLLLILWKKVEDSYELGDTEFKINNLLFMDDFKLFAQNQD